MSNEICTAIILAMVLTSVIAHVRLPQATHLPMNWGFSGTANSFAPRIMALAITPILANIVVALAAFVSPHAVIETAIVAMIFFIVHLVHILMVHRHLTRS